jgi:hypothetical protein|tara:strand:- start:8628 stop:8864 length:237 start_codon:yes stop_codon:yes gene_type:complete
MKKIYYTTDIEFHNGDLELGATGNKTINVYDIETDNGTPSIVPFFGIECQLEDVSNEEILEYLDDNGFGDDEYEFVQL